MKFDNYKHFKNYCLKVAKNKEYTISNEQIKTIDKFEAIVTLLYSLESNIISFKKDVLDVISAYFRSGNIETAFSKMKYFIKKIQDFSNKETNFYYVTTSLNTMLDLGIEFKDDFILCNDSSTSIFYPSKIRALEIIDEEDKIYTINKIDTNYRGKPGVYFIYDNEGELVYVGKSTTCLMSRAFKSAEERKTLNFSKIELRECKSKSDVAIYEAYYIALYKPKYNKDLMFEDMPSIKLPDLEVTKCISRNIENEYSTYKYTCFKSRVMNIEEFVYLANKGYAALDTIENRNFYKDEGIYDKYEIQHKVHMEHMQQIKLNGMHSVGDLNLN